MLFQKSNPFPKSIYENIAYGLRIAGVRDRRMIAETVEDSLTCAALWDEVKIGCTRAHSAFPGVNSSVYASPAPSQAKPDIILMDEPCSALDPIATAKVDSQSSS